MDKQMDKRRDKQMDKQMDKRMATEQGDSYNCTPPKHEGL